MVGAPGEPVEFRADDGVNLPASRGLKKGIEGWSALLGATDAVINELTYRPASAASKGAEDGELIFRRLIVRADPRVEPGTDGCSCRALQLGLMAVPASSHSTS